MAPVLPLFLLFLLSLLRIGLALVALVALIALGLFFTLNFLLALLDDFGLSRNAHFHAKRKVADIDFDRFRNIDRKALNLDLAQQLLENAALLLHARRFALEHN